MILFTITLTFRRCDDGVSGVNRFHVQVRDCIFAHNRVNIEIVVFLAETFNFDNALFSQLGKLAKRAIYFANVFLYFWAHSMGP